MGSIRCGMASCSYWIGIPPGGTPNGLAFSPDEKYLYVGAGQNILRYEVRADGGIGNRRVLIDMSSVKLPSGADGMKVDERGNIYTTPQAVSGSFRRPACIWARFVCRGWPISRFASAIAKTIFFTMRRDLYRLRVNVPGIRPLA